MKPPYADSTISRKYRETGIDAAIINQLTNLLTACANFYYILEIDEARKVADSVATQEQFDALIPIFARNGSLPFYIESRSELYEDGSDTLLLIQKDFLLKENNSFDEKAAIELFNATEKYDGPPPLIEDWEIFYQLDKERAGKKLAVPPDLVQYLDIGYYEETPQAKAMLRFISTLNYEAVDDLTKSEAAEEALLDMIDIIKDVSIPLMQDTQRLLDTFEIYGFQLHSMAKVQEFLGLYTDLSNHTRMPSNKGQRPAEMARTSRGSPPQITFGPGIQKAIQSGQLNADELRQAFSQSTEWPAELRQNLVDEVDRVLKPGEERWIGGTVFKGDKIRPNDPCPCGSGKKYKKCCGKRVN